MFQHTAARRRLGAMYYGISTVIEVSTHSRPKAAGSMNLVSLMIGLFQHTAARRRLASTFSVLITFIEFQHTAARRRLVPKTPAPSDTKCFNTQPPEGGWQSFRTNWSVKTKFQHTAARRRLGIKDKYRKEIKMFQHTAARRRLDHTH